MTAMSRRAMLTNSCLVPSLLLLASGRSVGLLRRKLRMRCHWPSPWEIPSRSMIWQ